jgi:uncharacterized membrane protein YphA (DoxX/SURF4 family)
MKTIVTSDNSAALVRNSCEAIMARILTIALAGIFIVAGIYKWSDPATFEVSILHFELFPEWMVWPLVSIIPLIEVLAGLMCLTVRFAGAALHFLFFLTAAYTLLLLIEWLRGVEPGCACFGPQSAHLPYLALFARNFGLLTLEAFLIRTSLTDPAITPGIVDQLRSRPQ